MSAETDITTAAQAANDPRILAFGRLLGAANRLEYILGRSLEEQSGLSHSLFELLLVVGRAGGDGIAVRDIAQERVLTSGGATRLVQRGSERGYIRRRTSTGDRRVQIIELTPLGEEVLVAASIRHAENVQRFLLDVLGAEQADAFADSVRTLSRNAGRFLPTMP